MFSFFPGNFPISAGDADFFSSVPQIVPHTVVPLREKNKWNVWETERRLAEMLCVYNYPVTDKKKQRWELQVNPNCGSENIFLETCRVSFYN